MTEPTPSRRPGGRAGGHAEARTDARARLRELDQAHVWHPYTQSADHAADDYAIIARGDGRRLYDVDGRAFWDGVSSIWLNVHGHRVPEIDAAIRSQLDLVAHSTLLGQANVPSIELAARLVRHTPGLLRVFFSDNGSTAVEAAIKMAIQSWHLQGRDKTRVLSFEGGYHGDTLGCVAAAYVPAFHAPFRAAIAAPGPQLPFPDLYRGAHAGDPDATREATLEAADAILRAQAPDTAAIIVEPVQGVGGVRVPPPGWLAGLRALCDEHEVLLIADEVATGFGRTGTMFACQADGVTPDLMALGKGITGGYLPLAATLATEAIHDTFVGAYEEGKQFFHGHSYTGNQLGCAAGLASLQLLEERWDAITATGRWLAGRMEAMREAPFVGDVRGRGFMYAMELVADKQRKTPFAWEARAGWQVYKAARARGLLARPYGNHALFLPPLGSRQEELETMLGIYRDALEATALAPIPA